MSTSSSYRNVDDGAKATSRRQQKQQQHQAVRIVVRILPLLKLCRHGRFVATLERLCAAAVTNVARVCVSVCIRWRCCHLWPDTQAGCHAALSLNYLLDLLPPLVFVFAAFAKASCMRALMSPAQQTPLSALTHARPTTTTGSVASTDCHWMLRVFAAAAATLAISIPHNLVSECVLIARCRFFLCICVCVCVFRAWRCLPWWPLRCLAALHAIIFLVDDIYVNL